MSFMKPQIEQFTQHTFDEYSLCEDCYYTIHNGEPDAPSDDWSPDWESIPNNLTSKTTDDTGNEFLNEGEFSHSGCDCCNNGLAGTVYIAVDVDSIETKECYRWRLSASGYLDCTEWSVADSLVEAIDDCLGMYGDEFDDDDYATIASYLDELCDSFDWQEFVDGYLLALGFTATSDDGENTLFPCQGSFEDCYSADDVKDRMQESDYLTLLSDCIGFLTQSIELIASLPDAGWKQSIDWQQIGSDFHYTRNGHGTGFWDRGYPNDIGDKLTELSKPFGTFEMSASGFPIDKLIDEGWEGTDASLEISLFEYHLIWNPTPDDDGDIKFYYPIGFDDEDRKEHPTNFSWGCVKHLKTEEDWKAEFDWVDWESVFSSMGIDEMESFTRSDWFTSTTPSHFGRCIADLVDHYGTDEIFGTDYSEGTHIWDDDTKFTIHN